MNKIFNFKKLRTYFLFISIVQILIVSYFAYKIVNEKYQISNEISKIGELSKIATYQSEVIDNLQRERGMSSSFVSSNGQLFASELKTQREKTDISVSKLLTQYNDLDLSNFSEPIVVTIQNTQKELKRLNEMRNNIDKISIVPIAVRSFYTGIINAFISNIATIKESSSLDNELYNNTATFYNLIEFKERLGRTRALYVNILNDKKNI